MTDADKVPKPIVPGPEMEALDRFYPDVTWTGTIEAGGMGPGSPAQTAKGGASAGAMQDGRWIVGSYEQDQLLLDGTFVLRWQLHWVVGWDPTNAEYRATIADNYGHADVMRQQIRRRSPCLREHRRPDCWIASDVGCVGPGGHHLAQQGDSQWATLRGRWSRNTT